MKKNLKLKSLLWNQGITQRDLSKTTKIPEAYISLGLSGRYVFNSLERAKIARALGVPESEIFKE
jgi:hypothetical protein